MSPQPLPPAQKVAPETPDAFFEKHLRHICLSFQKTGVPLRDSP